MAAFEKAEAKGSQTTGDGLALNTSANDFAQGVTGVGYCLFDCEGLGACTAGGGPGQVRILPDNGHEYCQDRPVPAGCKPRGYSQNYADQYVNCCVPSAAECSTQNKGCQECGNDSCRGTCDTSGTRCQGCSGPGSLDSFPSCSCRRP
jgi:hypothetical protein